MTASNDHAGPPPAGGVPETPGSGGRHAAHPGGPEPGEATVGARIGQAADPAHEPAPAHAEGVDPDLADDPTGDQRVDQPVDPGAELATAQAAVGALTNDLKRLQAEYVNYKRRVDRDRELVQQNAVFSVLTGLMPVLDDIDRAREHGELEGGFKAVADSLERTVAAHGLVRFGARGDEFDPRLHEALLHSHAPDVTTTTCQDVITAGYRIGDRVVRAARVTVVDPEPSNAE